MAPPVRHSQSWGGRSGGRARGEQPGRVPLVGHDGPLGQQRPEGLAHRLGGQGAGRAGSGDCRLLARSGSPAAAPTSSASAATAGDHVVRRAGHRVDGAPLGHQVAQLARVGEERHRATWRRGAPGGGARPGASRRTRPGRPSRSTGGRPAPRASRAGNVSHSSSAPVDGGQVGDGVEQRPRTGPPADEQGGTARRTAAPRPPPPPRRSSGAVPRAGTGAGPGGDRCHRRRPRTTRRRPAG